MKGSWRSVEKDGRPTEPGFYLCLRYNYRDEDARKRYGYGESVSVCYLNPNSDHFLSENVETNPVRYWQPIELPGGDVTAEKKEIQRQADEAHGALRALCKGNPAMIESGGVVARYIGWSEASIAYLEMKVAELQERLDVDG